MSSGSCCHVDQYTEDKGICPYTLINAFYVTCIADNARHRKVQDCFCYECETKVNRIHACLSCVHFGCFTKGHIQKHAKEESHHLAVDISFGTVYCFKCEDHMYYPDFEAELRKQTVLAAKCMGTESYVPWQPTKEEIELFQEYKVIKNINKDKYRGLRGLVNIGQICCFNSIFQALTHTPLLRDFFLSDQNECLHFEPTSTCLVCEMSILFQEFYSEKRKPFIPLQLMRVIWNTSPCFKIGEQSDAHEIYIEILNILHSQSKGKIDESGFCKCIVDQLFSGLLQSDVICMDCQTISTTVHPFMDIPLEIVSNSLPAPYSHTGASGSSSNVAASLQDCLLRYTDLEYLEERKCEKCQSCKGSTKQLTLKKMPVVSTFHLQRKTNLKKMEKIEDFISFPEYLDMTPFMSYSDRKFSGCEEAENSLNDRNNKFCLFAVVEHLGGGKGGHNIAYIKHCNNEWFKCDDSKVTAASKEDVLNCKGYLLFYHKQILEYEH